jgi:hypothetical protein
LVSVADWFAVTGALGVAPGFAWTGTGWRLFCILAVLVSVAVWFTVIGALGIVSRPAWTRCVFGSIITMAQTELIGILQSLFRLQAPLGHLASGFF